MTPTTLVGTGAFTKAGPERYSDGGLWLEEGTTNLVLNPSAEVNLTGINVDGGTTVTRDPSEHLDGDYSAKVAHNGSSGVGVNFQTRTSLGGSSRGFTASGHTKDASLHNLRIALFASYGDATIATLGQLNFASGGDWQRNAAAGTSDGAKTLNFLRARLLVNGNQSAGEYFADGIQIEEKPYATSLAISTMGDGYSLNGNNEHVRAPSSATLDPAGIIDTYLGAIVFRLTPTIETGVEEVWGELGEKGAGTDHIQWGRDSSKHPFVEWSGNDSAYTRITLDGTVDAGDEHFYSIEWHVGDEIFTLYQDALPGESDAIPSPQEDYGGESLTLKASAGGVIYNGILIANERLTDEQRATLLSKENWSMNTLSAPQRRYEFFQLRPGV